MNAQCVTPAQCSRVAEVGQDRDDAQKRWQAAMITGAVFGAASLATLILWPNVEKKKERALNIVPQSTGLSGGGVLFTGSF
jgi:hypothetical protein